LNKRKIKNKIKVASVLIIVVAIQTGSTAIGIAFSNKLPLLVITTTAIASSILFIIDGKFRKNKCREFKRMKPRPSHCIPYSQRLSSRIALVDVRNQTT
jgi:hypothetical protein